MNPVDVDVEDVLSDVACVLVERETGRSQSYHSEVREIDDIIYLMPGAWESIVNSLTALDQSLAPVGAASGAGGLAEAVEGGGPIGSVKRFVKRLVEKSIYWYVHPVVAQLHSMHASMTRALHEMADQVKIVSDRLEVMEKDAISARLRALEGERFDERIGRLERAWRQRGTEAQSAPVLPAADPAAPAGPVRAPSLERGSRSSEPLFHFDYYWFESIHRGDRALIKRRQQPYLEFFEGCSNVLDIGCGRGEFLELMMEKGIGGYGIDIEADSVQFCADSGLKAIRAEAIEHLSALAPEALDGVFISQVAEHMTPDELIELVGLAYRGIKSGGFIVIETPNPQCLLIFASFFYADLSHVQPIHPETMRFLLLSAGFRDVEIKLTNPVPRNQRLAKVVVGDVGAGEGWVDELNANVDKLNSVLFSYMDYAAVARK